MSNGQPPPIAQPRVAAGALFTDPTGRVLLVRPVYKPGWDIPGGYLEPGESPRDACIREVREELGITPNPGEGDKMLFVFDGGTLGTDQEALIQLQASELAEYAFTEADRLVDALAPRQSRRLGVALAARRVGHPLYAEHGAQLDSLAS